MKCPRCGNEMTLDSHRKIPLNMCYDCGYIEGRAVSGTEEDITNYEHTKTLNFNEFVAFLSTGLGVDETKLAEWLGSTVE